MSDSLTRRQLSEIIADKTLNIKNDKLLAKQLAAYLLHENKTTDLEPLMRDIMQYRLEHGVVEADLFSAHELTTQVINDIEQLIKQDYPDVKQITLHQKQDEKVVGGVRVQLPEQQLDLSVADKLAQLKRLTAERIG